MRFKDIPKVPFVYRPCKNLPGLIAIRIDEELTPAEVINSKLLQSNIKEKQ
jgi:hypothetical protein